MEGLSGLIMIVTIAAAVLQIVLFFKIWVMCDDIRAIRGNFSLSSDFRFNIRKMILLGDKEKAKELILNRFFEAIKDVNYKDAASDEAKKYNDKEFLRIKQELENALSKIGEEMPEEIKNLKSGDDFYNLY